MNLYSAYRLRKTSNALITLVETEQDCLKELFKTVRTCLSVCLYHKEPRYGTPRSTQPSIPPG